MRLVHLVVLLVVLANECRAVCAPNARNYDGQCNNLGNPLLGKAGTFFIRGPEGVGYADGHRAPREGPNAHLVSTRIGTDSGPSGTPLNISAVSGVYFFRWALSFSSG